MSKKLIIRGMRSYQSNPQNRKSSFKVCLEIGSNDNTMVGDLEFRKSFTTMKSADRFKKNSVIPKYPVGDELPNKYSWGEKMRKSIASDGSHYINCKE